MKKQESRPPPTRCEYQPNNFFVGENVSIADFLAEVVDEALPIFAAIYNPFGDRTSTQNFLALDRAHKHPSTNVTISIQPGGDMIKRTCGEAMLTIFADRNLQLV